MGRTTWIAMVLALAIAALLAAAWIDAGREPMRWIEQPVANPDLQRPAQPDAQTGAKMDTQSDERR